MRPGSGRKLGKEMPPRSRLDLQASSRGPRRAPPRGRASRRCGPWGSTGRDALADARRRSGVPVSAAIVPGPGCELRVSSSSLSAGRRKRASPSAIGAVGDDVELALGAEQADGAVGEDRRRRRRRPATSRPALTVGPPPGRERASASSTSGRRRRAPSAPASSGGPSGPACPRRLEAPLEHAPAAGDDGLGAAFPRARRARAPRGRGPSRPRRGRPARESAPPTSSSGTTTSSRSGGGRYAAVVEQVEGADEGGEPAFHVDRAGRHQAVAVELGRHRPAGRCRDGRSGGGARGEVSAPRAWSTGRGECRPPGASSRISTASPRARRADAEPFRGLRAAPRDRRSARRWRSARGGGRRSVRRGVRGDRYAVPCREAYLSPGRRRQRHRLV